MSLRRSALVCTTYSMVEYVKEEAQEERTEKEAFILDFRRTLPPYRACAFSSIMHEILYYFLFAGVAYFSVRPVRIHWAVGYSYPSH